MAEQANGGSGTNEIFQLYRRALSQQWNAERDIDWKVDVKRSEAEKKALIGIITTYSGAR